MYQNFRIAVILPCLNEEKQLPGTIATLPNWIDRIFVVDDASTDQTVQVAKDLAKTDSRIEILQHATRGGMGKGRTTGFGKCIEEKIDIAVTMDGDGQMDPHDLPALVNPIVEGKVDYSKGNRFIYPGGLKKIPRTRLIGNFILSALTKLASGYWHVSDSQCGYTAVNLSALEAIDIQDIYPTYGCPNDILVKMNIAGQRMGEVPVNPLYGVGEVSKMRIVKVIFPISRLLCRSFVERIYKKYVLQTGHPLALAYLSAFIGFICSGLLGIYILVRLFQEWMLPKAALMIAGFCVVSTLQLLVLAFFMDFEDNRNLQVILRSPFKK